MRSTTWPEPGAIAAGPADPHRHILRVEWLPVAGPDAPVQACLLAGDPSAFDPRAFAQAGIECPERVARSVRKRQADFYFGRVAARLALTRLDGHAPDVPIGTSGEPQWPATRVGSITHSRDLAAAAVAPRAQVGALGIDIEHVVDPPALDALWTLALDQRERSMLERVSANLTIETLATIVFSGKESLFKAIFPRVRRLLGFDSARLTALDPNARTLTFGLLDGLGSAILPGADCTVRFQTIAPGVVFTSFAT